MPREIEFLFDFGSPNAYFVHRALGDYTAGGAVSFRYRDGRQENGVSVADAVARVCERDGLPLWRQVRAVVDVVHARERGVLVQVDFEDDLPGLVQAPAAAEEASARRRKVAASMPMVTSTCAASPGAPSGRSPCPSTEARTTPRTNTSP